MIKSLPFVYNAKKVHYSSFDMFQERAFHHKVPGNRVASKVSEKQPLIRTFSNILDSKHCFQHEMLAKSLYFITASFIRLYITVLIVFTVVPYFKKL